MKPYALWPPPAGIELKPPYHVQLGTPSYEVCRNCAFEFGFDDDPGSGIRGESFETYRLTWIAGGHAGLFGGRNPPREVEPPE